VGTSRWCGCSLEVTSRGRLLAKSSVKPEKLTFVQCLYCFDIFASDLGTKAGNKVARKVRVRRQSVSYLYLNCIDRTEYILSKVSLAVLIGYWTLNLHELGGPLFYEATTSWI
jgi:hypothetical protein